MNAARTQVAQNRKARHNYHIEETLEAGLVLVGSQRERETRPRIAAPVKQALTSRWRG